MHKTSPYINVVIADNPPVSSFVYYGAEENFSFSNAIGHNDYYCGATLENNFWLLDGSYLLPSDSPVNFGILGSVISDGYGVVDSAEQRGEIIFNSPSSVNDIRIKFSVGTEDYCTELEVLLYDNSGSVLYDEIINPDSSDFLFSPGVLSVKKVVIYFNKTNNPNRRVRVENISFEDSYKISSDNIKGGKIVEQISPMSFELYMNSAEAEIMATDNYDDTITIAGVGTISLPENTILDFYEKYDKGSLYLGRFYVDKWGNIGNKKIKILSSDYVKFLNAKYVYSDFSGSGTSLYWSDLQAIQLLMGNLGADYYTNIPSSTYVHGYIDPIGEAREIISRRMFCYGGYATTARSDKILLLKSYESDPSIYPGYYENTITLSDEKIYRTENRKAITGVEIISNHIDLNTNPVEQVFQTDYAAGTHEVWTTGGPYTSHVFSGSAISVQIITKNNYVKFSTSTSGTVILSAKKVNAPAGVFRSPIYSEENPISIDTKGAINADDASDMADRLYSYYSRRIYQRARVYGFNPKVGETILMQLPNGDYVSGYVERCEIDIAGGFNPIIDVLGVKQ